MNTQRARVRVWAFIIIWRMHMQIFAVGVNKKSMIYSFRGPFWTVLMHVRTFSYDF